MIHNSMPAYAVLAFEHAPDVVGDLLGWSQSTQRPTYPILSSGTIISRSLEGLAAAAADARYKST